MDADSVALIGLGLGVAVLLGVALARRTDLPDPVVFVLVGLVASLLPGAPEVELPPDLVFLLFLQPLLYRASFLTSPRTMLEHATPLALLSVGLVLATAGAVALVVSTLVPGFGFAEGLVLGAILAPTDPVAASAVFSRLGAPKRVVDLVEGEGLINDATALVLYALALEAVLGETPTVGHVAGRLVLTVVGGVAVGVVVALAVGLLRARVQDVGLQLLLSLLTPYLAYLPADHFELSGVLAVVTTGLALGAGADGLFRPAVRLQADALWSLLDLLLNASLFVLLGLQVRRLLGDTPELAPLELVAVAAAVVAVVVGVRVLWQVVVPPPLYVVRRALGRPDARSTLPERLLIGWTGMRGAISLAAALALPLQTPDGPYEQRSLLLFVTVVVILVTLLVQGGTLPLLLRLERLSTEDDAGEQERVTRLALVDVALARLDELEADGDVPPGGVGPLRQLWLQSRARLGQDDEGVEDPVGDLSGLRLELARVQAVELDRRERDGLSSQVVRSLRRELDLQRVRLGGS